MIHKPNMIHVYGTHILYKKPLSESHSHTVIKAVSSAKILCRFYADSGIGNKKHQLQLSEKCHSKYCNYKYLMYFAIGRTRRLNTVLFSKHIIHTVYKKRQSTFLYNIVLAYKMLLCSITSVSQSLNQVKKQIQLSNKITTNEIQIKLKLSSIMSLCQKTICACFTLFQFLQEIVWKLKSTDWQLASFIKVIYNSD